MAETNTPTRVKIMSYLIERSGDRLGFVTPQFPSGISFRRLGVIRNSEGVIRISSPPSAGKPMISFRDNTARQRFTDAIIDAIKIDAPDLLRKE